MRQYHTAVREVFRLCTSALRNVHNVVVYGEYFGGWFPHDEIVSNGPGVGTPVQKGIVAYAPAHHFYAFDICVDGRFLDFDEAHS